MDPNSPPSGRGVGGGGAPDIRRPRNSGRRPPRDALPPTPRRATPARKVARCGAGAGSPRQHRPHLGHTGRGTPATRPRGRAAGEGTATASDTRRPSQPAPRHTNDTDPPHGGRTTPSQEGGNRDRTAPPPSTPDGARDRGRTRGGARTTLNGPTSAQCRDSAGCARHTTKGGGGARERERTHTQRARGDYQKGNRTELAERTDRVDWRTSERG